jgi:hypothetical protein
MRWPDEMRSSDLLSAVFVRARTPADWMAERLVRTVIAMRRASTGKKGERREGLWALSDGRRR